MSRQKDNDTASPELQNGRSQAALPCSLAALLVSWKLRKIKDADFAAEAGARRVIRPSPVGSDTDFAELNGFIENAAVSRLIFVR